MDSQHLGAAVTNCFILAEEKAAQWLAARNRAVGEEFVTTFVYSEFGFQLKEASDKKVFEKAFEKDVLAFKTRNWSSLEITGDVHALSRGLIARITPHNHQAEGRTGGDFGLLYSCPSLKRDRYNKQVTIVFDRVGLLCQAKRRHANGRWGTTTNEQRNVLPELRDLAALYYFDILQEQKKRFPMFSWKVGKNFDPHAWETALTKQSSDPTEHRDSKSVLTDLTAGQIGTKDPKTLKEYVELTESPRFQIEVCWSDRNQPDPSKIIVPIKHSVRQVKQQRLYLPR